MMLEAASMFVGGGGGGGGGGAETPPRQPSPLGSSSLASPEHPMRQSQQAASGRRGTASPVPARESGVRPLRPPASTKQEKRDRRAHDNRAFAEGLELDSELRA